MTDSSEGRSPDRRETFLRVGLILSLGLILGCTLVPASAPTMSSAAFPGLCTACDSPRTVEFLLNIILFIPVAALAALVMRRPWRVLLFGVALSLLIETLQQWIPGRLASPRDVVANTLGACFGIGVWLVARSWMRRRQLVERRLAVVSAVGWTLAVCLATFAEMPARPRLPLRTLVANGQRDVDVAGMMSSLRRGSGQFDFSVPLLHERQQVALVVDAGGREVLDVYAANDALVTRVRARARDMGLLQRALHVDNALPRSRPTRVRGSIRLHKGTVGVELREPRSGSYTGHWDVADIWAFFYPAGRLTALTKLILRWTVSASLILPAAFWVGRQERGVGALAGLAVGTAAVLALAPLLLGSVLSSAVAFGGTGVGVLIGGSVGAWTKRRERVPSHEVS